MTKPNGPIVGGVHLDDGVHTKFIWMDEQGMQNPASIGDGTNVDTFGGPVMVHPNWASIPSRKLIFPGYMFPVAQSVSVGKGQREFMEWLRKSYARISRTGVPSKVVIGNSYYRGYPTNLDITKFKSHGSILGYSFDLTPDSGAWVQSYRNAINPGGFARIRFDTPALERNTGNVSGIPVVFNNPGDMPTKLVASISFSAAVRATRFYVRVVPVNGQAPRRAAFTPNASGIAVITEQDNVVLAPGDNWIRIEEANGSLVSSSAIFLSGYGTKFRYSNPSGPDLWPIFAHGRWSVGYVSTSAASTASQTLRPPEEVRQGTIDNYLAANVGVLVEADTTNYLTASQEFDAVDWTKTTSTVTANAATAPNGDITGDRITHTALAGNCNQTVTTNSAGKVTLSVFAKTGTIGTTLFLQIFDNTGAVSLVSQSSTVSATWTRYSITTPASVLSGRSLNLRIGADQASATANVDVWGAQCESLSYRSSYVPTIVAALGATNSNSARGMDILHLDNPHNYLAYSNDFRKQTTTQGTPGLWFLDPGCTLSATSVAGPFINTLNATQITFAASGDFIEQKIVNSELLIGQLVAGKPARVTFSVWARSSTSSRSNLILRLVDRSGANVSSLNFTAYENWTRYSITVSIGSGGIDRVRFEGTSASTQYIYGAQLTSHNWNGDTTSPMPECREVYTETRSVPVLPDNCACDWPEFMSQNGFVQFDIRNNEITKPDQEGRLYFGGFSNSTVEPQHPVVFRGNLEVSASNQVRFARLTTLGTAVWATSTATNIYDGNFHTMRIEWLNYINSAGVRVMQTNLVIDGVTTSSTAGASDVAWVTAPKFIFAQGRNAIYNVSYRCNSVYKNISMGVPTLPAGAVPAQY